MSQTAQGKKPVKWIFIGESFELSAGTMFNNPMKYISTSFFLTSNNQKCFSKYSNMEFEKKVWNLKKKIRSDLIGEAWMQWLYSELKFERKYKELDQI